MRALILVCVLLLSSVSIAGRSVAPAAAVDLELTECDYVESINQMPSTNLRPLVPLDFQMGALVSFVVGIARCTATTSAGETDEVAFGWADVSVSPRAGLRSPEGGLSLYRIEHITRDDLYGRIHGEFGAECRVSETMEVLASLLDTHATATDADGLVWDIRAPAGPPPTGDVGRTHYREYGAAHGGYVYLEGDLVNPGAALVPGSFLVDADSALFGVWGPAWPSAIQASGGWAIEDTTISFIPWASAPAPKATC